MPSRYSYYHATTLCKLIVLVITVAYQTGCETKNQQTIKAQPPNVITDDQIEIANKHHEQAIAAIQENNWDEAEKQLKSALKHNPEFGKAYNNLGLVDFQKKDYYSAAWNFKSAIQQMPQAAEPVFNLGLVYEKAGKTEKAASLFKQAYGKSPDNIIYLCHLTKARIHRGDDDQKIATHLQQIIQANVSIEWTRWAQVQLRKLNIEEYR